MYPNAPQVAVSKHGFADSVCAVFGKNGGVESLSATLCPITPNTPKLRSPSLHETCRRPTSAWVPQTSCHWPLVLSRPRTSPASTSGGISQRSEEHTSELQS